MKNTIIYVLIFISGLTVAYLLTSFVMYEFDPGKWTEEGRAACVLFGAMASVFSIWFKRLMQD